MAEFPAMPLYTDAYLADTTHLTAQEHGVYLLLLMAAWRSPTLSLPNDDVLLARYAKVGTRTWAKIKGNILAFWRIEDGAWVQGKQQRIRKQVELKTASSRRNGKLGGRPKSLRNHDTPEATGSLEETQEKPTKTKTKEEEKKDAAVPAAPALPGEDPEKALFDRGKAVLGKTAGGLIKNLLKATGNVALARAAIEQASAKSDPREYVAGCIRRAEAQQADIVRPARPYRPYDPICGGSDGVPKPVKRGESQWAI